MTTMPVPSGFVVTSPFAKRWGTFHWGTDFGKPGGSGGQPVHAVKDGVVQYAGPASGFGQWVTVDHPASNGGGYTIYGHVVPEVKPGQAVKEGQRIAHINPNSNTNGGVAPHLHFEWHRFGWSRPGPNRLDPMSMLRGAEWPGAKPRHNKTPNNGVIFGVDVSEHQSGLHLGGIPGIDFVIARTTDGTHKDKTYRSHIRDAENAGLVTAAYHYLRAPSEGSTVAQQVEASLEVMGDLRRPIWLDVETDGGTLTVRDIRVAKRLFEARGVRVVGVYSYISYWEGRISGGEPNSHEFGAVWLANYPSTQRVDYRRLWEIAKSSWKFDYPLGNQKPVIWQYGSTGQVPGAPTGVDVNAFKGTKEDIKKLFYGVKTPQRKDINVLKKITSLVNPKKSFELPRLVAFIDAATWENRVLIREIARRQGIDPDKVIEDAKARDAEGK